jgi:hypothetical protein
MQREISIVICSNPWPKHGKKQVQIVDEPRAPSNLQPTYSEGGVGPDLASDVGGAASVVCVGVGAAGAASVAPVEGWGGTGGGGGVGRRGLVEL